ncbi:MFS transporter [Halobellus sp. GM3]|uniref:MFS transporter n=1 Tax=Halobellus sp. GM3 TaxID=3458410 RepID=UPI00403D8CFA
MNPVGTFKREARALVGDGKGGPLGVIAGTWGVLLGTRMIYPVLLPYFRETFAISLTVAGFLVTILWLGTAIGQLPGGVLTDRYSERSMMAFSTAVVALAVLAVATARTALVLFVATGLLGLGQSLYPIARITILANIYPDRIGSALGVTMATGDLGQTVLPPIAGTLAVAYAWQVGLGFVAPLLAVAAVALWVILPRETAADASRGPSGGSLAEMARDVRTALGQENVLFFAFILFLYIFVWQAFTALYPTYLVEQKELSSGLASLLFSLFFAVGVVVKPLAGAMYDRVGIRAALVSILAPPAVGLAVLPLADGVLALTAVTILVSSMLGSGAITQSYFSDSFPEAVRGTGLGVVRTATMTIGASGPVVLGTIADRGYFDESYWLLAVIIFVVVLLTLRLSGGSDAA